MDAARVVEKGGREAWHSFIVHFKVIRRQAHEKIFVDSGFNMAARRPEDRVSNSVFPSTNLISSGG